MATLKNYNEFSDWDILDSFYKYKVKGFNIKIDKTFERSFCRCGNVEGSFMDKCPKCGNISFINFNNDKINILGNPTVYFENMETITSRLDFESSKIPGNNESSIYRSDLDLVLPNKRNIQIKVHKDTFARYKDKTLVEFDLSKIHKIYGKTYIDEIKNFSNGEESFQSFIDYIKDYESSYKDNMDLVLKNIETSKFINDFNETPVIENDVLLAVLLAQKDFFGGGFNSMFKKYEFIRNSLFFDLFFMKLLKLRLFSVYHYSFDIQNKLDYFYRTTINKIIKLDKRIDENTKKILTLLNISCKKNKSLYVAFEYPFNSLFNRNYFSNEEKHNIFDYFNLLESFSSTCPEYLNISTLTSHYVENGMMEWQESYNILEHLIDDVEKFDIPPEIEFFEYFIKENVTNLNENFYNSFIDRIDEMKSLKIPIKPENFKIKSYNFYKNQKSLADIYRLPKDKVSMFIDMFEVNPLKSMNFIANRRKLTKKEIDKFIDDITK